MKYLDKSNDERANCLSILIKMTIKEYLSLVEDAYDNKGNLFGQRAPLKTKSAQKIRKRMISDLGNGAILPPVVIGVIVTKDGFEVIDKDAESSLPKLMKQVDPQKHINIIDGMQRTTALYEAIEQYDLNIDKEIRVELWIAKKSNSLLYRMLVLNSGQIPWNLKRQVEIIFRQLSNEISQKVSDLKLIHMGDQSRRSQPGEYQAADFIELFILFGLKRPIINLQDQISEEFARLDFAETSSKNEFTEFFLGATKSLVSLDKSMAQLAELSTDLNTGRYKKGLDLFTSQPARVGFIVAFSRYIYGLSGLSYEQEITIHKYSNIIKKLDVLFKTINELDPYELEEFIDFPSLFERIKVPTGKVGDFEREFFTKSFTTLFQILESDTKFLSFTPLWQS